MKFVKVKSVALLSIAAVLAVGFAWPNKTSATVPGVNELVSVDSSGSLANQYSSDNAVSSDGRYVAFTSKASNLVTGDTNGEDDVFLRDTVNNVTTRISVDSSGAQANNYSFYPRISHEGRFIVYSSNASNLASGDTNGTTDVFIYDVQNATTTLVSSNSSGTIGNSVSYRPDVSADGRFVTFESYASNLVSGISGYGVGEQIYVKDMSTGAIKALSVSSSGAQANAASHNARISCDGNVVAFTSGASNLVSGDTNGKQDVFVDSLGWNGDKLTSPTLAGNNDSYTNQVSCDGNYIALGSSASNLVPGDTNGYGDVFRYNRLNSQLDLVSTTTSGTQANSNSDWGTISDNGRYMAFHTDATNLDSRVPVTNGNIYIHDMKTGVTDLVTITVGGYGQGYAQMPSISADGSYVSYQSAAEENPNPTRAIVPGDNNGYADIIISQTGY